jgi:hypothetical protein
VTTWLAIAAMNTACGLGRGTGRFHAYMFDEPGAAENNSCSRPR